MLRHRQIKVYAAPPLRRYTNWHKNVANVLPPLQQTAIKCEMLRRRVDTNQMTLRKK
jgi:hypothetical protein